MKRKNDLNYAIYVSSRVFSRTVHSRQNNKVEPITTIEMTYFVTELIDIIQLNLLLFVRSTRTTVCGHQSR